MKLGIGLVILLTAGCQSKQPAVYVDLEAVELSDRSPSMNGIGTPSIGLPAQTSMLAGLGPAQLDLSATRARLEEARELLKNNRADALRSLANALYRAYASEAETERTAKTRALESDSQLIREQADARISARLKLLADRRWPLADRLAYLIGFPFSSPERLPAPENPQDARRHAQAVEIWKQLLAQDAEFKAEVVRIMADAEADLASKRAQLLIDFTRSLNSASDRAQQEAQAAIAANSGDAMGRFAENEDVIVPSSPKKEVRFAAIPPLKRPSVMAMEETARRTRLELEHELSIWLAQNGYRRVVHSGAGPDRTQEFKAWLDARNIGR